MPNVATEERVMNTVTVGPGLKTKFYFVPVTGLQNGTHFRDVWLHLKKVVKRLEHIEIYPDSSKGWICVHRYSNFLKVISTLSEPLHVQATDSSSVVTPSGKNKDEQVVIRLPISCSEHVSAVINHAASCVGLPASGEPVTVDMKIQASDSKLPYTRHEVVIAHGTYKPVIADGSCNLVGSDAGSKTSRETSQSPTMLPPRHYGGSQITPTEPPTGAYFNYSPYQSRAYPTTWQPLTNYSNSQITGPGFGYEVYQPSPSIPPNYWYGGHQTFEESAYPSPGWYYWDPSTYYSQPTGNQAPVVPTRPAMERRHTVLLSNFQRNTTTYQVEALVNRVAQRYRLRDRRIQVIGGIMVITKTKGDARKLRDGLNGQVLNGVAIRAKRGWRAPPGLLAGSSTRIWG